MTEFVRSASPTTQEKRLKNAKRWNKENAEKVAENQRRHDLKKKYGMSVEDYGIRLSKQNGVCAICGNKETRTVKGKVVALAVDHDHKSGKIRELLCSRCNKLIGQVNEDKYLLFKMIIYLRKHE